MKEEYLNKLLNVGNDAVNEAREKYQAERNHELQSGI